LNRSGITVIMVTHDPEIAEHAQRIIHIKDGKISSDERKNEPLPPLRGKAGMGGHAADILIPPPQSSPTRGEDVQLEHPEFTFTELREYGGSALRAIAANKIRSG